VTITEKIGVLVSARVRAVLTTVLEVLSTRYIGLAEMKAKGTELKKPGFMQS